MNRFDIGLEGAVTTKSNNFVGPALGVRLTHRNIFRGGENLTYGVDAFYDFPTGALRRAASDSRGFIISGALTYPVVITPLRIATHSHYGLPKAIVGISLEWNFRPEYFRVVNWKLNYGINWQPTSRTSHLLKWVELNYANVLTTTPSFDSILDSNTLIKSSFSNQFMIGPGYTFVYNTTREEDLAHQLYFQFGANLSGNVVSGIQSIFGQSGEEAKQFLGITYAQFARLRSDFRYYFNFNKSSRLVARLAAGVGFAYGNSDVMPFVTQFYTGGGTSLRPLAARIIGPGTYLPLGTDYDPSNTIEQSGDVFTEANVEYRFDIIYKLKGALWTDVGNIYLRKPDPQRPGGEFEISSFLRKSIMTSGVGLRVDFDFIVLRWDVGFISYYPWLEEGQRWFWQNDLNLFGGVINIGYPF
jgi:hypothetical protein